MLRIVGLFGVAVGTRILTGAVEPSTFGTFKLATGAALLATAVTIRPLVTYSMREWHFAQSNGLADGFVRRCRTTIASISSTVFALSVVATVVAYVLGQNSFATVFAAAGAYAFAQSLVGLEQGLLVSKGRYLVSAAADAVASIALPIVAAMAAILIAQAPAAMVGAQAGALTVLAASLRHLNPTTGNRRYPAILKSSMRFTLPLAAVGGLSWVFNLGDRYLLAAFSTSAEVGVYSAAYALGTAPMTALGRLVPTMTFEPLLRRASEGAEGDRIRLARRVTVIQLGLMVVSVTGIVLLAPLAVDLLLAPAYHAEATQILRWAAAGQGLQVAAFVFDLESVSVSRTGRQLIAYSASAFTTIVLGIVLIPSGGGTAAAMATAAGGLVYFLVMYLFSRRTMGVRALGING